MGDSLLLRRVLDLFIILWQEREVVLFTLNVVAVKLSDCAVRSYNLAVT